ncbi:hypothetical protein JTE90_014766 [Oedothorax gibbosus]|uniref:Gustatory receptor n=1 Tax=Oedothorax gibbosus TaxID=931172 RepID=A0AAV6URG7_9ARAC|nr:hypothetical protein JTE90_014766 [Oedothorax gibbosus]
MVKYNEMTLVGEYQWCSSVSNGYGVLWLVLKIMGIDVFKRQHGNKSRNFVISYLLPNIFPFILISMLVVFVCGGIICVLSGDNFAMHASVTIIYLISMAIWFSANKNKNKLRSLVIQFHGINVTGGNKTRPLSFSINVSLSTIHIINILCVIGHIMFIPENTPELIDYVKLMIPKQMYIIRLLFRIGVIWISFVILSFLPVLASVLCGSIYFRCSQLLEDFHDELFTSVSEPSRAELVRLSQKHRLLCKLAHAVRRRLSSIAFMVLSSIMLSMFITLSYFINIITEKTPISAIWLGMILGYCIVGSFTVLVLILTASRVHLKYREINATLENILHRLTSQDPIEWKSVAVVKRRTRNLAPVLAPFPKLTRIYPGEGKSVTHLQHLSCVGIFERSISPFPAPRIREAG